MFDEKLITVITSVYNKAKYLETWAISLASQTYLNKARILIIDDASTDGSLELVKEYIAKYRIPAEIFVHEKNLGLLHTILEAYRFVDTKYFTVLDADDYWLTERKIEKAVKFLEAHEDYSAYCSNYLREQSNEENRFEFPMNLPNQTFVNADEVPGHIHTASIVFRNFFTPGLLNEMDRVSNGKRVHACETDSFMNYLAFQFGKIYLENSVDSVWRASIGIFGGLTKFEQDLNIMHEHWQIFDFYAKNFGTDKNASRALVLCVSYYYQSVELFTDMLKNCTLSKFQSKKHFRERFFDYGETDIEKIVNALLEQEKNLNQLGFKLDGNNFFVDIKMYKG